MEQKVTICIGGSRYALTANSPEQEEIFRLAGRSVNKLLSTYTEKFPGKEMTEILTMVALNESIASITMKKKIEAIERERDTLGELTDSYLENIDNQPPAGTR